MFLCLSLPNRQSFSCGDSGQASGGLRVEGVRLSWVHCLRRGFPSIHTRGFPVGDDDDFLSSGLITCGPLFPCRSVTWLPLGESCPRGEPRLRPR